MIDCKKLINRINLKLKHEVLRYRVKLSRWDEMIVNNREHSIIVSFTSYPKRFSDLELCIKSIVNQSMKPDKIILWLGNDTVKNDVIKLRTKYEKYGVEIVHIEDENLMSHKKYYYAFQQYKNSIIITADDDLIYPKDWIESMYNTFLNYPNCICARRVHQITWNSDDNVKPYKNWIGESETIIPSHNLLATTGAGTLFPPNCFNEECMNKDVFMKYARTADDIWIKIMAVISNVKVVWVPNKMQMPTTIDLHQTDKLANCNCNLCLNDQIFNDLCGYYNLFKKDFFK